MQGSDCSPALSAGWLVTITAGKGLSYDHVELFTVWIDVACQARSPIVGAGDVAAGADMIGYC